MATTIPFTIDLTRQGTLDRLAWLAWFTDSSIRVPFTSRTFGVDALLSLVPGAGSLIGSGLSLYVIAEALRHGAPAGLLARMGVYIAADTVLGSIPLAGVIFDMAFKANQRNLALLRAHLKG